MKVNQIKFNERNKRTKYLFDNFNEYFGSKILDVGCDRAVLKTMLEKNVDYTGIDICGTPDITINLEQIDKLPFEDDSFDCVICLDVLEHLDNLHLIFDELIRVSRKNLIISWPNNWVNARVPIQRGYGNFKFFGLPSEKPVDRHKWFFNISQAREFVQEYCRKNSNIELIEERATEKPKNILSKIARSLRYPNKMHYLNRYAHTYWTVLRKQ